MERAPYGRLREGFQLPTYRGENYYDQPVIKSSHYGHLVAAYLFVGGLAGCAQVMANIAELCNRPAYRPMIRAGRYIALLGSTVAPVLLIADLKTPGRWYNMLRIFRPTSPMSFGSWTLAGFGSATAVTAALEFLAHRTAHARYERAACWFGIPAAGLGALTATYTGVLLASTSTPLWASGHRLLPVLFGTSAAATATGALSLAAHLYPSAGAAKKPLELLGVISAAGELLVTTALERQWQKDEVMTPLEQEPVRSAYRYGYKGLGVVAPLIVHGIGLFLHRRSSRWSLAAAAATLAGSYLLRSIIVSAGNTSAQRAADYFRLTQPYEPVHSAEPPSLVAPPQEHARSGEPSSLVTQCNHARERLERTAHLPPSEIVREVDHIEKLLTSMRDALIERLRVTHQSSTADRDRAALERLNAAISLIIAAEYPIGAIERSTLVKARDLLGQILKENLLVEREDATHN